MVGEGVFEGLRFKLEGFEKEDEDKYRMEIMKRGGTIDKLYNWRGLHLIVCSTTQTLSDQTCKKALETDSGSVLVTELWLEDCMESGVRADTEDVLYRPLASLGGIKGAQQYKIAHVGFSSEETRRIEKLIDMIGAQSVEMSNASYLICNRLQDYEAAKTNGLFNVSKKWLEDTVYEWDIKSVDAYSSWPKKAERNYRTPIKENSDVDSERGASSSTGSKGKALLEAKRGSKRNAVSAGPKYLPAERHVTLSRRSINFNWQRLSQYNASEMLVTVQIPRSRTEIAIGSDDIKAAILGSFTSMANYHCGGQCVRNSVIADSFSVSANSEQVIMEHAQLVEYDESLALANRRDFVLMVKNLFKSKGCKVPLDISVWLSCIIDVDKVPDKLLKRHVNMLHAVDIYGAFMSMYAIVLNLRKEDFNKYTLIVESEHLTQYRFWDQKNLKWELLQKALTYIPPNLVELKTLRSKVSKSGDIGEVITCKAKVRDDDAFGLLEVIRDCFSHPALSYIDFLLPVLLTQYPTLLSDLQRTLYELGHLKNLR